MILVYIHDNKLLTYRFNCSTFEHEFIEDDIKGMDSEQVAKEIALSRKSLL